MKREDELKINYNTAQSVKSFTVDKDTKQYSWN